jgi:hypothetical protein
MTEAVDILNWLASAKANPDFGLIEVRVFLPTGPAKGVLSPLKGYVPNSELENLSRELANYYRSDWKLIWNSEKHEDREERKLVGTWKLTKATVQILAILTIRKNSLSVSGVIEALETAESLTDKEPAPRKGTRIFPKTKS